LGPMHNLVAKSLTYARGSGAGNPASDAAPLRFSISPDCGHFHSISVSKEQRHTFAFEFAGRVVTTVKSTDCRNPGTRYFRVLTSKGNIVRATNDLLDPRDMRQRRLGIEIAGRALGENQCVC
jgi:hypothetical protein